MYWKVISTSGRVRFQDISLSAVIVVAGRTLTPTTIAPDPTARPSEYTISSSAPFTLPPSRTSARPGISAATIDNAKKLTPGFPTKL